MPRRLYDISPPIDERLNVWPGDVPYTRTLSGHISTGSTVTTSVIRSTTHMGSHADAPSHYGLDAPTIDQMPLDLYVGECQVVTVNAKHGTRVTPEQVEAAIDLPRVILRTNTFPDFTRWNKDFAGLSPELVDLMFEMGVKLVGVDTPSVDLFDSKDLPAHKAFLRHEMAIIEGLVLKEVPDGVYELIAVPLKLMGCDASPVRAVLREPA
jgi:arylformamidase